VIVGVIRRKPVLTHASIVCEGMLASVNSVKFGEFGEFDIRGLEYPCKHQHMARLLSTSFAILLIWYLHASKWFTHCNATTVPVVGTSSTVTRSCQKSLHGLGAMLELINNTPSLGINDAIFWRQQRCYVDKLELRFSPPLIFHLVRRTWCAVPAAIDDTPSRCSWPFG